MRTNTNTLMIAALTSLALMTATADAAVIISACGIFTNLPNGTAASNSQTCGGNAPNGTGLAAADLATGALRTKATGTISSPGSAGATFKDTVTILGSLPNAVQFHVQLNVHGSISGPPGFDVNFNGNGSLQAAALDTSNALFNAFSIIQLRNYNGGNNPLTNLPDLTGTATQNVLSLVPANVDYVIDNLVTVDSAHRSFTLIASLGAAAAPVIAGVLVVDFSNTAVLSILLPNGLAFQSASGVLLSNPSTVPLPPALLLLGTGLFTVAALKRRMDQKSGTSIELGAGCAGMRRCDDVGESE